MPSSTAGTVVAEGGPALARSSTFMRPPGDGGSVGGSGSPQGKSPGGSFTNSLEGTFHDVRLPPALASPWRIQLLVGGRRSHRAGPAAQAVDVCGFRHVQKA